MFKIEYNINNKVNVNFIKEDNINKDLLTLKDLGVFNGKNNEMYLDLNLNNEGSIYLGLSDESNLEDLRKIGFNLGNALNIRKVVKVSVDLANLLDDLSVGAFLEGLMNSQYNFDYYKTKKNDFKLESVSLNNLKNKDIVNETYNLVNALFKGRDFVNYAPIDLYPNSYAQRWKNYLKILK